MGLVFVMVQSAWTARVNSEPERVCWHVLSPGEGEQPWGYPARIQPSHLQVWSQTFKLRYAIALKSENQIFKFPSPQKNISPLSADNVSYKAWLFLPQLKEVGHKDQLYSMHFPGRQAPAGHSLRCHEGVVWAGVCNSAPSPSPVMLWQGHSIPHHPQGCVGPPAHLVWGGQGPTCSWQWESHRLHISLWSSPPKQADGKLWGSAFSYSIKFISILLPKCPHLQKIQELMHKGSPLPQRKGIAS